MRQRATASYQESPAQAWGGVGLSMIGIALFWIGWIELLLLLVFLVLCAVLAICLRKRPIAEDSSRYPEAIAGLLTISHDEQLSAIHGQILEALVATSAKSDGIFRDLADQRFSSIVQQLRTLSAGTIEYSSTESWRVAYEQLLRSPGLHLYRSVAYVESAHYWQDGPGQQSTRLNLELHDSRSISIERTVIIADHLWPLDSLFPMQPIHSWLDEQHRHGIWIRLVRESVVAEEPDLLADFGIYGNRAVGIQIADPAGRTIRFQLKFDFDKVVQAESIWGRLAVYATSYRELLEQQH